MINRNHNSRINDIRKNKFSNILKYIEIFHLIMNQIRLTYSDKDKHTPIIRSKMLCKNVYTIFESIIHSVDSIISPMPCEHFVTIL